MVKTMNLHRVQQKGDIVLSKEYEKYRTFQQKKEERNTPQYCISRYDGYI